MYAELIWLIGMFQSIVDISSFKQRKASLDYKKITYNRVKQKSI